MSHEFRTPLNAILGYTSMLLKGVSGELAANQRRNLERIDSNSQHLLSIINDILDISRIEAGKMPLTLAEFPIPDLVREVLAEVEPLIARAQLSVTTEVDGGLPPLRSDRQKVKQIVINLITNALKFTPQGWVTVTAAVDRRPTGWPSRCPTAASASRPRTRRDLRGLPSGRRLADPPVHAAPAWAWPSAVAWPRCWAASSPCGARWARGRPSPWPCRAHPRTTVTTSAPPTLVLLVDDYPDNRDIYVQFLTYSGLRVEEAENGHQALDKAFALRPDVIVMDLSLPGLDGWEATRRLKGDPRTRDIPVIALTGHALAGHSKGAFDAGCDVFITKPCLPERLLEEIHTILGAARPRSGEPTS